MEPLLQLLVFGVGGSLLSLLAVFRRREKTEIWQKAAQAAGLTGVQISDFLGFASRMTGQAGSLQVRVDGYQRGKQERGTRITVGGLRHGAYALTIRAEGFSTAIEKTFGERETELGDEAFDHAAYLQAAPGLLRAIFDADTRRLLRPLLEGEWRVEGRSGSTKLSVRTHVSDSELQVEIKESLFGNVLGAFPEALARVVDLAKRLARPDDLAAAIAANTRREPVAAVRLGNVQLLAREHGSHAATRETLLAALKDDEPAVRLQAAVALGPDGRATLLECATGDQFSDGIAQRAIAALAADFPVDAAVERLRRARKADQTRTALACIDVIGRAGTPETVKELALVLGHGSEELAAAAARGLGLAPSETAERALVSALGHDGAGVRVAAAESLGRIGTPTAVASLRECAGAHTFDGALRKAAREAIAEIQARVSGASPGQLSLAAEGAGQVSLVEEDRRGQVSLEPTSPTRSP
jgi:HEAT repeat protein